jgi:hypothetical protein
VSNSKSLALPLGQRQQQGDAEAQLEGAQVVQEVLVVGEVDDAGKRAGRGPAQPPAISMPAPARARMAATYGCPSRPPAAAGFLSGWLVIFLLLAGWPGGRPSSTHQVTADIALVVGNCAHVGVLPSWTAATGPWVDDYTSPEHTRVCPSRGDGGHRAPGTGSRGAPDIPLRVPVCLVGIRWASVSPTVGSVRGTGGRQ